MPDIIEAIWVILGLLVLYLCKMLYEKITKKKTNQVIIDRRQHCTEHPQLMRTTLQLQIDIAEVKTDVKWIKRNLNNNNKR